MNKFLLSSAFATLLVATASASNFSVSGPGGAIPDVSGVNTWNVTYAGVPLTSTVTVANPVTSITKVRLSGFSHTWRGDLHIFITNPAGTIFNVAVRPGSTGASVGDSGDYLLGQYDFVDAGGGAINQGAVNISPGTYNIYQNTGTGMWTLGAVNGPLSAITGAAGTWSLVIRDWAGGDIGQISGWTLEGTDSGSSGPVVFCDPGFGGVVPCPCSNPPSGSGRGCENSNATGGASIGATGSSSLANDTLVISTAGQVNSTTLIWQGDADISGSGGVVSGMGVRCVGGNLKRLYGAGGGLLGSGGSVTVPPAGDLTPSAKSASLGDPLLPGMTRYYFAAYRDPSVLGGCPATSTFNYSNAVGVTWN